MEATRPSDAANTFLGSGPPPFDALRLAVLKEGLAERLFGRSESETRVGRYVVRRLLGEGAMGQVYLGFDPMLGREVALKLLRTSAGGFGTAAFERMKREAKALARLNHPHVVPILDVGMHDDLPFVAMEYVRGTTLHQWCLDHGSDDPRRLERLLDFAAQAAEGLAAAHDVGLVHRDIKPTNLLVGDDGRLRIADFGLARDVDAVTTSGAAADDRSTGDGEHLPSITQPGNAPGTFVYMAPEQLAGHPGPASDQFAWAVTFYEALLGRRPFDEHDAAERLWLVAKRIVPPPRPGFGAPRRIIALLKRCMSFQPDARYPTMAAVRRRLTQRDRKPIAIGGSIAALLLVAGAIARAGAASHCEPLVDRGIGWQAAAERFETEVSERDEPVWDGLDRSLRAYDHRWSSARRDLCRRATQGEIEATEAEAQLACLERLRRVARGFIGGRPEAWPELRDADVLEPVENCLEPRPTASGGSPLVQQVLDEALGAELANDTDRARRTYDAAIRLAANLGDEFGRGRALFDRGRFLDGIGEEAEAHLVIEEAYYVAVGCGDASTAAYAAMGLVQIYGDRPDLELAARWRGHAEAAIARLPAPRTTMIAHLQTSWAAALQVSGRFDEALRAHESALEWLKSNPSTRRDNLEGAWLSYGEALLVAGRPEDAQRAFDAAYAIATEIYDGEHPKLASLLALQGQAFQLAGDFAGSQPLLERALAIIEANEMQGQSVSHENSSRHENSIRLARALAETGRSERAIELVDEALAFWNEHDPSSFALLDVWQTRAVALAKLGRFTEARAAAEQLIVSTETLVGADHPHSGGALVLLAQIALELDDRELARASLERAREPLLGFRPHDRPVIEFELAYAEAYRRDGAYDSALGYAEDALRRAGPLDLAAAHRLVGQIRLARHDWLDAIEHLQRAAQMLEGDERRAVERDLARARRR